MDSLKSAFQMFGASVKVLWSRKELAIFPVLSAIATVLAEAILVVPAAVFAFSLTGDAATVASYAVSALGLIVTGYVAIFFNAALVSQANIALGGGDPTVAGGLRVAGSKAGRLLPWALLSVTVSVILRLLEERGRGANPAAPLIRYFTRGAGLAWDLLTYLVLPILVLEDRRLGDALKQSAAKFKRTWGQNVVGNLGIKTLGFLVGLLGAGGLLTLGVKSDSGTTLLVCLLATLLWCTLIAVATSALYGIYQTALYRYTTDGKVGGAFQGIDMSHAFRRKSRMPRKSRSAKSLARGIKR